MYAYNVNDRITDNAVRRLLIQKAAENNGLSLSIIEANGGDGLIYGRLGYCFERDQESGGEIMVASVPVLIDGDEKHLPDELIEMAPVSVAWSQKTGAAWLAPVDHPRFAELGSAIIEMAEEDRLRRLAWFGYSADEAFANRHAMATTLAKQQPAKVIDLGKARKARKGGIK
ncbi:MAG: hypothetical protein ACPGOY_13890 [Rhodospirillaceae bacterium]